MIIRCANLCAMIQRVLADITRRSNGFVRWIYVSSSGSDKTQPLVDFESIRRLMSDFTGALALVVAGHALDGTALDESLPLTDIASLFPAGERLLSQVAPFLATDWAVR